jgi:hypothetical protein
MIRNPSRKQLFVHQNNLLSFSYRRGKFTKEKFDEYLQSKTREETQPILQHEPSVYLHTVKDGIYDIDYKNNVHLYCSLGNLKRLYHQSDSVYYYVLRHLNLNLFYNRTYSPSQEKVEYVCSTFYPEDILEINQDYYKITFRDIVRPLYLQSSVKLFDESGHRKSILDIVHRMGKRKVLGLNHNLEFQTYAIERVENITAEDENITVLDTPFYAIGVTRESEGDNCVLMNQIFVDLD